MKYTNLLEMYTYKWEENKCTNTKYSQCLVLSTKLWMTFIFFLCFIDFSTLSKHFFKRELTDFKLLLVTRDSPSPFIQMVGIERSATEIAKEWRHSQHPAETPWLLIASVYSRVIDESSMKIPPGTFGPFSILWSSKSVSLFVWGTPKGHNFFHLPYQHAITKVCDRPIWPLNAAWKLCYFENVIPPGH